MFRECYQKKQRLVIILIALVVVGLLIGFGFLLDHLLSNDLPVSQLRLVQQDDTTSQPSATTPIKIPKQLLGSDVPSYSPNLQSLQLLKENNKNFTSDNGDEYYYTDMEDVENVPWSELLQSIDIGVLSIPKAYGSTINVNEETIYSNDNYISATDAGTNIQLQTDTINTDADGWFIHGVTHLKIQRDDFQYITRWYQEQSENIQIFRLLPHDDITHNVNSNSMPRIECYDLSTAWGYPTSSAVDVVTSANGAMTIQRNTEDNYHEFSARYTFIPDKIRTDTIIMQMLHLASYSLQILIREDAEQAGLYNLLYVKATPHRTHIIIHDIMNTNDKTNTIPSNTNYDITIFDNGMNHAVYVNGVIVVEGNMLVRGTDPINRVRWGMNTRSNDATIQKEMLLFVTGAYVGVVQSEELYTNLLSIQSGNAPIDHFQSYFIQDDNGEWQDNNHNHNHTYNNDNGDREASLDASSKPSVQQQKVDIPKSPVPATIEPTTQYPTVALSPTLLLTQLPTQAPTIVSPVPVVLPGIEDFYTDLQDVENIPWLDFVETIPVATPSIPVALGSTIQVNENLVYNDCPFLDNTISVWGWSIHTLTQSSIRRPSYPFMTRWYQEQNNNIQVYRLFPDEDNVRNDRISSPRVESFSHTTTWGYPMSREIDNENWYEYTGRFTCLKVRNNMAIFQLIHLTSWSMQIIIKEDEELPGVLNLLYVKFLPRANTIIARDILGKNVDLTVIDDGINHAVFVNGKLVVEGNEIERGTAPSNRVRWGMYTPQGIVDQDLLLIVTGARSSRPQMPYSLDYYSSDNDNRLDTNEDVVQLYHDQDSNGSWFGITKAEAFSG